MGEDKDKKEKKERKSKKTKDEPKAEAAEASASAAEEEEPKKVEKTEEESPRESKPAKRGTSNVFAMFNQSQITEFKEAFTMIDQDRDGIISEGDLAAIWQQIGRDPEAKILREMVNEAPGQLNFTHFLNLFGEKLHGTDPENSLRDAFIMFDPEGKGKLDENYVKDLLMNVGDQFSADEIKQTWKEAPVDGGMLDYLKFVRLIKRGGEEQ